MPSIDSSFDAIVVGARVAGSATAIMLARQGRRVLILDKATFPSDTLSTHIVMSGGARVLETMGVMARLEALGGVRFNAMRTLGPDFDYQGELRDGAGNPAPGLCLSRRVMDAVLIEAARDLTPITLRLATRVTGVIVHDGAIVGVRAAGPRGEQEFRAPLTIGADGRRSDFARLAAARLGAFALTQVPCGRVYYYAYFEDVDRARLGDTLVSEFEARPGAGALVCRCERGRVVAALAFDAREMAAFRTRLSANFSAALTASRIVGTLLTGARIASRIFSSGPLLNLERVPTCDGALLLGDAGLHPDPLFGQGHSLALMSVELMAAMAPRWFSATHGDSVSADALAAFTEQRERLLLPFYRASVRASKDTPLEPLTHAAHRAAAAEQWAADEMVRFSQLIPAVPFPSFRFTRLLARYAPARPRRSAADADAAH